MKYLVSVIMPCLNSEKTVGEAIQSVLSQDYKNIELIIVDDGSSDATVAIVEGHRSHDGRLKLLYNNGVHGVSYARNIGLNAAQGKFICFLDSDDYLLPGSIAVRVKTLTDNDAKIVYGAYLKLLPNGKFLKKNSLPRVTFNDMLRKNYIGNLTGMYNAEALGKLPQQSIRHEDYLMWCQLLRREKYAFSTGLEPIAVYRVSSGSLSGNKFKAFIWHWTILRRGLQLDVFSSFCYQSFYFVASLCERINYIYKRTSKIPAGRINGGGLD